MTASVQAKGNKYYVVLSWKSNDETKKRNQKWINTGLTVDGNNKRKAEQKRIELLCEWQNKITLNESDMLFSDYMKEWLEETKHEIETNTYYSYKQMIYGTICPYFEKKKIKISDLKPYHIQAFYNERMDIYGVSANTIYHYHANIHKALNDAVKTERIASNPSDKVTLPKKTKHVANYYTLEELKKLLENCKGTELETVIQLAAWFGLRRGEIIGLQWSSIDFDANTLYIKGTVKDKGASGSRIKNLRYEESAKTSSSLRAFPLSQQTKEYLLSLKAVQDKRKLDKNYNHQWDNFICVRNNGDLIPLDYVSRTFPDFCQKCGLGRLKLHELRHTNISLLLDAGASMKELQEWAGHSSYSTTANTYSHIQAKSKQNLIEALETSLM